MLCLIQVTACTTRTVTAVTPEQTIEEYKDIPVNANRDVDILFVIDNSDSMKDEQLAITSNFRRFTEVLERIEGGLPNVHLGVISTDVGGCGGPGDAGRLQHVARTPGCSPPSGTFISAEKGEDGSLMTNYSGTLADAFACIGYLGINGCGFEQQLESMRLALDAGANPGFLRPDATLAVIFLTDEDDCSAHDQTLFTGPEDVLGPGTSFRCTEYGLLCDGEPVTRSPGELEGCEPRGASSTDDNEYLWHPQVYVDFVKSLKRDPKQVFVAGIMGPTSPVEIRVGDEGDAQLDYSCGDGRISNEPSAKPAIRLEYFLDSFPGQNTFTSICDEDLSGALSQVATRLASIIGNTCLEGNLDTTDLDPDAPGLQVECNVAQVSAGQDDPIPRCAVDAEDHLDPSNTVFPCWHVETDLEHCSAFPTQLELVVERNGAQAPADAHVIAGCRIE